ARVHVLQVARTVHEHHHRVLAPWLHLFGAVVLAPDGAGAVGRGDLHDFRLDPLAGAELGRARVGELAGAAASGIHHRNLRGQVGARVADQQLRAVGRQDEVLHAVQRRDLADLAAVAVDGADLVVAGPGAVAGEVEGRAVRRQLRRGDFPLAG